MNYEEKSMDTKECPKCKSNRVGLTFALEYEKNEDGTVVLTNPYFSCVTCEHLWQVKRVMVVSTFPNPEYFSWKLNETFEQ